MCEIFFAGIGGMGSKETMGHHWLGNQQHLNYSARKKPNTKQTRPNRSKSEEKADRIINKVTIEHNSIEMVCVISNVGGTSPLRDLSINLIRGTTNSPSESPIPLT